MSTRRIGRAAVLLLAAALVTAACTSDPADGGAGDDVAVPLPTIGLGSDTGTADRPVAVDADRIARAVMIGDSITVGASPYLAARFEEAGLPVEIGAQNGKRIDVSSPSNPAGTRIAEDFSASTGDDAIWVVALGTNDIGQYAEVGEVEQEIRDLLAAVPTEAPVVWINTWFRDRPDATEMVNDAIDTVVTERGNSTIGDWTALAPLDGVLISDGVHPGDDGAKVFADFVVGTVRTFLQR